MKIEDERRVWKIELVEWVEVSKPLQRQSAHFFFQIEEVACTNSSLLAKDGVVEEPHKRPNGVS